MKNKLYNKAYYERKRKKEEKEKSDLLKIVRNGDKIRWSEYDEKIKTI